MAKKTKKAKKTTKAKKSKTGSKRREWTPGDITEMKKLAKAKTPAAKIAAALKRSTGATRQKAFSLGLSLNSR